MSKKCTPSWREAHFQVKMYKAHHAPSTFGSWVVEKAHAAVARSTFRSQNVKTTPAPDHFWRFRCRFAWQAPGKCAKYCAGRPAKNGMLPTKRLQNPPGEGQRAPRSVWSQTSAAFLTPRKTSQKAPGKSAKYCAGRPAKNGAQYGQSTAQGGLQRRDVAHQKGPGSVWS